MTREQLVRILYRARRNGSGVSETRDVINDPEEALETQLGVSRLFEAELGDPVAGWKVGMTSGKSKDLMGKGFRPFGYILRSRSIPSHSRVELSSHLPHVIEPEICLVVGSPIKGYVSETEVRSAIRAVAPAFEIGELRTDPAHASNALLIADGLANWGIVFGEGIPVEDFPGPKAVELRHEGALVAEATVGQDIEMDDPFSSLARLVQLLGRFGLGLHPEDRVITGSFVTRPASPGKWTASFDGLGNVAVEVA